MKRSLILLAVALPLVAQNLLYYASVGALAGGTAADSISRWGRKAANPLLGSTVNAESLAVKSGVLGGTVLLQRYAIRKSPKMRRPLTRLNSAVGAAPGGVAFAILDSGVRNEPGSVLSGMEEMPCSSVSSSVIRSFANNERALRSAGTQME